MVIFWNHLSYLLLFLLTEKLQQKGGEGSVMAPNVVRSADTRYMAEDRKCDGEQVGCFLCWWLRPLLQCEAEAEVPPGYPS